MAATSGGSGQGASLVGRSHQLVDALAVLAADLPLCLSGESGIGKTTLLEAVLSADGRPVHRGGGLATLSWMPFLAVARAVGRTSFDLDEPAAVADVVEAAVGADVLFVDDLHACDPGSRAVVELLADRITVVTAVRLGHEGTEGALDSVRRSGFRLLELDPLDDADSREVALRAHPGMGDTDLARVVERSGGVPLLLEELASGAEEATLVRALGARLSALDDDARTAAVLLAVAGRPVDDDLPAFGALVTAHVATSAGAGFVQIRHALLADAVLAGASEAQVRAAHRDLAGRTTSAIVRARHLLDAGLPIEAREAAAEAVVEATTPGARADARLLAVRIGVATGDLGTSDADEMLLAADDLVTAFRAADAVEVLDRLDGLDLDVDRRARALTARLPAAWSLSDIDSVTAAVEEGAQLVARTDPRIGRRLRYQICRVRILSYDDNAAALADAETNLADTRAAGDPEAAARLLVGSAKYFLDYTSAEDDMRSALLAARAEGDADTEMRAANNLSALLEAIGSTAESVAVAQEYAARADALGMADWRMQLLAMAASTLTSAGRLGEALELLDSLIPVASDPRTRMQVLSNRADCLVHLDLGAPADEALSAAEAQARTHQIIEGERGVALTRGLWLWQQGRLAEAIASLDAVDLTGPDDGYGLAAAVLSHWVALDGGPAPSVPEYTGVETLWPGGRTEVEALVLSLAGDHAGAALTFEAAADQWSARWRYEELRCRWAAADELRKAGDPSAVDRLLEVEARLLDIGYGYLVTRSHRSLRLAGLVRASERSPDRGSLLSAREREVLGLAASGLNNSEIARRLSLGAPTVRRHVSNAVVKLGVPTRTAAVAAYSALQAG